MWGRKYSKSAHKCQRGPSSRRRLICLPLVPSLSWIEDQGQRRIYEVKRERDHEDQGCLCNFSHRHLKEDTPIQKVHLPKIKWTIKSQATSKPLHPTGDPPKWLRLKVRDHGGREDRETPFPWVPLLWALTILQPSILACEMEGRKRDWTGRAPFSLKFYSYASFFLFTGSLGWTGTHKQPELSQRG